MNESNFLREDRYIVIKRSDVDTFWRDDVREQFMSALERLNEHHVRTPQRQFLVIESDWPEYEPAWHMIERRVNGVAGRLPEVVAVINEEGEHFKETVVEHRPGIDRLPVGTELVDRAHVNRLQAERDALQLRLNAADQRVDLLTSARPGSPNRAWPWQWLALNMQTKRLPTATSSPTTLTAATGSRIAQMEKAGSAWRFTTPTTALSAGGHAAR